MYFVIALQLKKLVYLSYKSYCITMYIPHLQYNTLPRRSWAARGPALRKPRQILVQKGHMQQEHSCTWWRNTTCKQVKVNQSRTDANHK